MRPFLINMHIGFALVCFAASNSCIADVVELRGGGQVEGSVSRQEKDRAPYAIVQIDSKLKIAIPETQIARVADNANLEEYRQRVKVTQEVANEHYELARWCKSKQLNAQCRHHHQRAIALEPDHKESRAALDYVIHDGKWIRNAERQKIRGMISVAGRDRLPEEVALRDARDELNIEVKKWTREIPKLRTAVIRGGDKGVDAFAQLAAIDDRNAAYAIASELGNSANQPRNLRLLWIDRLGIFGNRPALEALVKMGLFDADFAVQEAALETLQKVSPSTAVANYVQLLKSNDNAVVRSAAKALGYFPDPEIVLPLVDALVTEHKREIPADQSTKVGFGSDGSGGMSAGGKAQVISMKIENPPVLAVLRTIEADADYGYNQMLWREHFARRLSRYSGDMRRDP